MRSKTAADYLDVSQATFLARVDQGKYPPGQLEIGVRLWLKDDLDAMIDRQYGVSSRVELDDDDPFKAPAKDGKRGTTATL